MEVAAAFTAAMIADQQILAATADGVTRPATLRPAPARDVLTSAVRVPSQAERAEARIAREDLVRRYFTGSAASAAPAVAAADAQPDAVSIDGGASAIRIRSLSVSGSDARVVAEVDDWAAMAQRSPAGGWNVAVPENTIDAETGLVRAADGRWVVSDLEWSFHPGSEP